MRGHGDPGDLGDTGPQWKLTLGVSLGGGHGDTGAEGFHVRGFSRRKMDTQGAVGTLGHKKGSHQGLHCSGTWGHEDSGDTGTLGQRQGSHQGLLQAAAG